MGGKTKRDYKGIVVIIIMLLVFGIGYGFGYSSGVYDTISWGYQKASYFITLDIDEEEVHEIIRKYKDMIDIRYPS